MMKARPSLLIVAPSCGLALACATALLPAASEPGAVTFNEHIRPILADRCFSCHGPDSAARKGGLRLDREESAMAALSEGVVPIVPGQPDKSAVIHRLTNGDPDERMPPPESKLTVTPEEIELIRAWIAAGASWERHWAFIPPRKAGPEAIRNHPWQRNEIDAFVLHTLSSHNLQPSPPADRAHLLRRLTFDLTGLPPTLAELDGFLLDDSEHAYERAVDRLLASPAFGERLALEWLDVARYGDTDGLFEDHPRSIFPWRDWLVTAFNENLPYSDFITFQLAGDLLPDATTAQKIATGFLRNNTTSNEGGLIEEDYRIKYLVDRVNTTSTAFLGLTMECAQCHDHKFDPMTQREYYELAAFFNSMIGNGNTKGATDPTLRSLAPEQEARLAGISAELATLEETLRQTPPALVADFEKWLVGIEQPVAWVAPEIVSDSRNDEASPPAPPHPASPVRGRFVRLARPPGSPGFLTLSEVEVHSGGENLARAGTATQSSDYGSNPARRAIDGNADGSFASCACTKEEQDAWWEVDLGSEVPIDHLVVYNRNDCCPERLDHAVLRVLDSDRKVIREENLGDAGFRSAFVCNPAAPPPAAGPKQYELVLRFPGEPRTLTALQLNGPQPGLLVEVKAEASGETARELKLTANAGIKVGPGQPPHLLGLDPPAELPPGTSVKLTITGAASVAVEATSDPTVLSRTQLPAGREERLARFRQDWPGHASERARRQTLSEEKDRIEKSAVITMIAGDVTPPRPTHILMRGEYDQPGEAVPPRAPASIMPFDEKLPANRLGLARWIIDPTNPLAARVAVNRYWQMLFGDGIVVTSEDFGTQGARPSHQALLDHLAVDFVESGWDLKRLLRTMVTSATYRQASIRTAQLAEVDPLNRLLARAPRLRLPAESIRDHALAVSGLLVDRRGGPGVNPYQPAVLFGSNAIGAAGTTFTLGTGDELYRRSLYTYWKRQIPAANMRILGADGRASCRTRRERTNTPLQALVLLNDPQFVEAARCLAERVMKEGGPDTRARLSHAFRLSTSRQPDQRELSVLHAEFNDRLAEFLRDPESARAYLAGGGQRQADPSLDAAEVAAFAAVCSLILNLDESLSKS